MIFLYRLGIVLHWVGFGFAILFAIVGLLIALNGLTSGGGAISGAWVYAVLSLVCWLWGRAIKYILTDTQFPPPGRTRAEGKEREMNPLDWKRPDQVAAIAFCAVGAIAGVFFAWMDSPFRQLSSHSVSGELPNATNVFLLWLSHVGLYWPWPLMGACAAGLAFYGGQLIRRN
jgi:hypothetical protein